MAQEDVTADVLEASARLRRAVDGGEAVVAMTGAGVSAESGIPTSRGAGGFWAGFAPKTWRRRRRSAVIPTKCGNGIIGGADSL